MAVNDIFEVTLRFVDGADSFNNVIHWRQTGSASALSRPALCQSLCERVNADINTFYVPYLNNSITHVGCDAFIVNDPVSAGTAANGTVGSLADQLISKRSAPVVSKVTAARGRSYRGRFFLCPLAEGQQDGGTLVGSAPTNLQGYVDAIRILANPEGDVWQMTVYSRTLSTLPGGPYIDNLVTSLILRPNCGSIRRRQSVTP